MILKVLAMGGAPPTAAGREPAEIDKAAAHWQTIVRNTATGSLGHCNPCANRPPTGKGEAGKDRDPIPAFLYQVSRFSRNLRWSTSLPAVCVPERGVNHLKASTSVREGGIDLPAPP